MTSFNNFLGQAAVWSFVVVLTSTVRCTVAVNSTACNETCTLCEDDICTECQPGYWGLVCGKDCKNCHQGICDKDTGRCRNCSPGLYGDACNLTCSRSCRPGNDNITSCQRETGHCVRCEFGISGTYCEEDSTRGKDPLVSTFELNIVAEDKREKEKGGNTVLERLAFTLILILIPFIFVFGVQVIALLRHWIRQKRNPYHAKFAPGSGRSPSLEQRELIGLNGEYKPSL